MSGYIMSPIEREELAGLQRLHEQGDLHNRAHIMRLKELRDQAGTLLQVNPLLNLQDMALTDGRIGAHSVGRRKFGPNHEELGLDLSQLRNHLLVVTRGHNEPDDGV